MQIATNSSGAYSFKKEPKSLHSDQLKTSQKHEKERSYSGSRRFDRFCDDLLRDQLIR